MSRTRAALTALALIPVLLVTGCSDDDPKPKFGPTPSATPSSAPASDTSIPAPPTMPAAGEGTGAASARAFVQHWVDTLNFAIESGNADALRALSSNRCKSCEGIASTIDDVYAGGGAMEGGLWSTRSLRSLPLDRGADWAGYLTADISAQTVTGPNKQVYDAGPGYMYIYVARGGDGWRVVYLDIPV